MIVDEFDDRSEDETVIATMIERDFFVAIERRQRALTASDATHVRVRHPHRRSSYWLTVLTARWWATRGA